MSAWQCLLSGRREDEVTGFAFWRDPPDVTAESTLET